MQKKLNKLLNNKQVILFDGFCNFCNSAVLKIIYNDKKNIFLFAPLQSHIGMQLTNYFTIDTKKLDSIILIESETSFYIKSTAALKIINQFNGFWKLLKIGWLLPTPLRDFFYSLIARNRYKWFGKKTSCMIPTKEIKSKFIA
ncbi:MAG: DCC1-like thiol-disulfide oxidoreductase family protein [Polaribacter sp.]|nr:DCC1-like thiol-disulfide oxidoreductase family protein [Polaribacter sp.]MDG1812153.1 DCC1-like thiol-disulfide oxidoreductase family protein [Polaribacter sp.]